MEIFYGGKLSGGSLAIISDEIILHDGCFVKASGGGYEAETGPGRGSNVSYLFLYY